MKAIVKVGIGYGEIAYMDIAEPEVLDNEVKIKVAYAGICGTDISIYTGKKKTEIPIVMGHEFSGMISEVGKNVTGWKVGDWVIAETTKEYCGQCHFCKTGQHSLCKKRGALGQQVDGVFSDYFCQKPEFLHRIPYGVSLMEAALVEPAACAYHAVHDLNDIKLNEKVLVIGPGPMGLLVLELLKAANASVVITGVHGDEERLEIAKKLGADYTAITPDENLDEIVENFTDGNGMDYVFDCAGFESCIQDAIRSVKRTGTIVQVGIPSAGGVTLSNYADIMLKEITVHGSFSHRYKDWDKVLDLIKAGKLQMKPLVSHVFELENAEEAFKSEGKIKVVFSINPEE